MESFGRWLKRQRELRGLSEGEVAARTKIPRATLEALEADRHDELPARAFVLGHLRSFAQVVGLDGEDVVLRFLEQAPPEEKTAPETRSESRLWLIGAVVLALGAVGYWILP